MMPPSFFPEVRLQQYNGDYKPPTEAEKIANTLATLGIELDDAGWPAGLPHDPINEGIAAGIQESVQRVITALDGADAVEAADALNTLENLRSFLHDPAEAGPLPVESRWVAGEQMFACFMEMLGRIDGHQARRLLKNLSSLQTPAGDVAQQSYGPDFLSREADIAAVMAYLGARIADRDKVSHRIRPIFSVLSDVRAQLIQWALRDQIVLADIDMAEREAMAEQVSATMRAWLHEVRAVQQLARLSLQGDLEQGMPSTLET